MAALRFIPQEVIARKRDGGRLSPSELRALLRGYLDGQVGDDQMAAFLMAVHFRGLGEEELNALVEEMLASGDELPRVESGLPRVDKHSTGGVGDKVSLALAPLAAEMGLLVPMVSGRGLGHTGGTLDKLESIPGFRTDVSVGRFNRILSSAGCAMMGQTREIAPLDRKLYALRDVTATVPSVPLIAASIMSKKLAERLDGLVLDVKVGEGAFLPRIDDARSLAETMVGVGRARGLGVSAVLTAMDRPLGRAVGNALEVREALECLAGGGPPDLWEIVVELAAEMNLVGAAVRDRAEGREVAAAVLASGAALERFQLMAEGHGGVLRTNREDFGLPRAPLTAEATAGREGLVAGVDPRALGYGLVAMGGGRTRRGREIDPRVGFELEVRVADRVAVGDPLALVHGASEDDVRVGTEAVKRAVSISDGLLPHLPLIVERIGPRRRAGDACRSARSPSGAPER